MTDVPSPGDVDLDLGATIRGFAPGQRLFDRYELKEILGRGGMGIVWRAFDAQLECDIALKFLPELLVLDRSAMDDLKRETKRSRELTHHHVVRIYDFVQDKHSACISMEYVDGQTLSALRVEKESKVFEADELGPVIEQACDALEYAHVKARIVHRDFKPSNLMLNSRGELKVTDFGIARSMSDSVSMLSLRTSGTLVYMSPQQLGGQRASALDDVYSLGASIYELLTSKPPFYSGDVSDQVKHATPVSMQQRRLDLEISGSQIPKNWEETVAACLAKDPARRPQSVREVAQRLGLTVPQYGSTKPQIGAIDLNHPQPSRRTKKATLLTTATAVIVLVGAIAVWWFGFQQPKQRAEQAERADEERQAKAAADQTAFDEKIKAAAAAQLAEEKHKADEAAAADAKKKEEEAKQITNSSKERPVPSNWEPQPLSGMRHASFLVKGANGATADISFVSLGGSAGSVLDNVNRWLSQLGQPAIDEQKLNQISQRLTTSTGEITVVDLMGLPQGADPAKDGRIIAAMASSGGSTLFFKMRGNAQLTASQKDDFVNWVATVCNSQSNGTPITAPSPKSSVVSPSPTAVAATAKTSVTPEPKKSFAGTWSGTIQVRCRDGTGSSEPAAVRVSSDERTVSDRLFGSWHTGTAHRSGDTLVWTGPSNKKLGWSHSWSLTLKTKDSAACVHKFTSNSGNCTDTGTLSRE